MLRRLSVFVGVVALALAASLGATAAPAQASGPLTIDWAVCESTWGTGLSRFFFCDASVSGGTGSYTYSWQGISNAGFSRPANDSVATGYCSTTRGGARWSSARVTVTDSGGATVSQDIGFWCRDEPA